MDDEMQNPPPPPPALSPTEQEAGPSAAAGGRSNPRQQANRHFLYGQNPTAGRGRPYLSSGMHGFDTTTDDENQSADEGSDQEPAPAAAAVAGNSSREMTSQLNTAGSSGSNPIQIPGRQPYRNFPLSSEFPNNPAALGNFHHPGGRHGFNPIQNPSASSSTEEEGSDQEMVNQLQFPDDFLSDLNPATAPENFHHPAGMLPGFSDFQYPSGHNRHQGMLPGEVAMARRPSGDVIRTGSISQLLGQAAHDMGQPSRATRQTVDVRHPAPEPRPNIIRAATAAAAAAAAAEPIGYECPLCGRDLTFQAGQVNRRVLLPTAAVLSCGHAFHADCLERITPAGSSTDPPCRVCEARGGRET